MDITAIIICLLVGIVVAFIAVGAMKAQLKSVGSQSAAANYIRSGSMVITEQEDLFLYRNVSRTPRPKNNNK